MSEQSPTPRDHTGTIGRYEISRTIGKGAMGVVYLAHDPLLERDVALKVMVSQIADDPALHERFQREAKAVAKMTHPNVVMVFDLGYHTDGSPYIAMELLKGQDLAKAMRAIPPLSLDKKVAVLVQVLAGLAHAHQAGIVHRDIKPANVFLNHDGHVKIMDFGVARLISASMTGTGNIIGTADYMSPEQVKGARVDGRSDLFSVGCMLYELVAGRRPFHAENLMAIFYKITHEEADFSHLPAGPAVEALKPILRRSLSKDLEARYQTAYEFAVDLKDYLREHAESATYQHALEGLLDMEAPTHRPQPLTDAPRATAAPEAGIATLRGADPTAITPQDHGRPGTPPPGLKRGQASVPLPPSGDSDATYIVTDRAVPRPPTAARPQAEAVPAPPPRRPGRSPLPFVALGVGALVVAGVVAWLLIGRAKPPLTSSLPPPDTTPTTADTTPPTVPRPAPPPTFEPSGKAAGALRAAQAAFITGDYERAVREAQAALKQDPASAEARRLLDNALQGQAADPRLRAAEAALAEGDHDRALREAQAAHALAPWDGRIPNLIARARAAQQQAKAIRPPPGPPPTAGQLPPPTAGKPPLPNGQINALLGQGDNALAASNYDGAIELYDEVLRLDPANARAGQQKAAAIAARAIARAAAQAKAVTGRTFVAGRTVATNAEPKGNLPPGFEDTPAATLGKSQAAATPGRILFDVEPNSVKAGDRYKVRVSLLNEGTAPIQIRDMMIGTRINGRGVQGVVAPMVRSVAPQQKALLREFPDFWKDDTASWAMEVTVRTVRGETYKNEVTWK